jgi:hypothetical protein
MKTILTTIAVAAVMLVTPAPAAATGDTGWSCPPVTEYVHKYDNLDGHTGTVPLIWPNNPNWVRP